MNPPNTSNPSTPRVTYDVFFSRGRATESNLGNVIYREMVSEFSQSYKSVNKTTLEKNTITKLIISTIEDLGGGFYHQKFRDGELIWEELGSKGLVKKVKQSLRDSKSKTQTTVNTRFMNSQFESSMSFHHDRRVCESLLQNHNNTSVQAIEMIPNEYADIPFAVPFSDPDSDVVKTAAAAGLESEETTQSSNDQPNNDCLLRAWQEAP